MNKSQLRKLAREYALGTLQEDEYRQRRRELIRDIVDGNVAIVREAPPPPPPPPDPGEATVETELELEIEPERSGISLLYVAVGLVIVIGLVWFFWPSEESDAPAEIAVIEQPLPVPQVSPARALVEEFVASHDFSEFSVQKFKESWGELSPADRENAITERWFNDLTNAISEEIKTQNALLEFDTSGNAMRTGKRLSELAAFLGVSEHVTEFRGRDKGTEQASASDDSAAKAPAEVTDIREPETASVAAEPAPMPAAKDTENRVSGRRTLGTASGAKWLEEQSPDDFTLQLFAVNHPEKIQALVAENPDVDLQVLVSAHSEPRYRVIHGAYQSAEAARAAHAALPESVRRAQPTPLVKTIGELRRDIADGDWIAALDAQKFTLQLFATDNSDNARRLIRKYPSLKLSLLDTTDARSRYRVLYGTFDSENMAKAAVSDLPRQLLHDAGDPLVKSVAELQAARR